MTIRFAFDTHHRLALGAIIASLLLGLFGSGSLAGSRIALIITVALQVFLPGYLLARTLGKLHHDAHPVTQFTWILAAGLSMTIVLGAAARLLEAPLPAYFIVLHGIMFALLWITPSTIEETQESWHFSRRNLPYYLIVLISCLVVTTIAYQRNQIRVRDFEDQTVFVSLADWLAHDPDDAGLRSRRAGVERGDIRWPTDGWTYNHAAWVRTSGVPAAQLLWYDINPLLAWTIPLVYFALAYQLTGRESAGALTAAALTVVGLLTLDSLVYGTPGLSFGQFALFQLNTLRNASTALMLPLSLFVALEYLRKPARQNLLVTALAGWMLVSLHPRQTMIFQATTGATVVLWWLAQPSRKRAHHGIALLIVLASLAILPLIQRSQQFGAIVRQTNRVEENLRSNDTEEQSDSGQFITLNDVPVFGATYIVRPTSVFYHPVITASMILGLAAIAFWRQTLAAQYIFGATLVTLFLLFTPLLTPIYVRLISVRLVTGTVFALPVALTLGLSIDLIWRRLSQNHRVKWGAVLVYLVLLGLTLFEPLSISASARDQIRAANQLQSTRDIRASDEALLENLQSHLPTDNRTILLTPSEVGTYIIESIPHTLITGGRRSRNRTHGNTQRFFNKPNEDFETIAPFFDTIDNDFITQRAVDYVIVEAGDTRLPQLWLQPRRFEFVDSPAGYVIFRVNDDGGDESSNALFAEMNAVYATLVTPRWEAGAFKLERDIDPAVWQAIAATWEDRLALAPDDNLAQYGLAMTYTLMGEDEAALPLWANLSEQHPNIFIFKEAIARIQREMGDTTGAIETLMRDFAGDSPQIQLLTARTLMSETFFFALSDTQLDMLLMAIDAHPILWEQFVTADHPTLVRQQAALLASAGRWEASAQWLDKLHEIELSPEEMVTQAAFALTQGDLESALNILKPATDSDWFAAKAHLHPDRWRDENNIAAQMYQVLSTPSASSNASILWALYNASSPYVINPTVTQNRDGSLQINAVFGNVHQRGFPVQTWYVTVANQDASIQYIEMEVPAHFPNTITTSASFVVTSAEIIVDLPEGIPTLTPALVFIEPRYSETVTFPEAIVNITLNRPEDATPPADAETIHLNFGDVITLDSYTISTNENTVEMTLYWETESTLSEDYQIFVHIVDDAGNVVAQQDTAPVNGRYPTSQWRTHVTIADPHTIVADEPLDNGDYSVRIGMYRLSDLTRLAITPTDSRVVDDSLLLHHFSSP